MALDDYKNHVAVAIMSIPLPPPVRIVLEDSSSSEEEVGVLLFDFNDVV